MKPIWFVCAWLSFIVGIIGIFVPVLPTTPFLILSAFLFSKSSPRFHAWILNSSIAGPSIKDWQQNRVIRMKAKVLCTLTISSSLIFLWVKDVHITLQIVVSVILVSVWSFVVSRKSK